MTELVVGTLLIWLFILHGVVFHTMSWVHKRGKAALRAKYGEEPT